MFCLDINIVCRKTRTHRKGPRTSGIEKGTKLSMFKISLEHQNEKLSRPSDAFSRVVMICLIKDLGFMPKSDVAAGLLR